MNQIVSICLFSLVTTSLYGQTLLCAQESVTVHYVTNKSEDGKRYDEWKIYLDIENKGTLDLFYTRPYKGSPLAGNEIIPAYLIINILNGTDVYTNQTNYVHGSATLHISADTLTMYKVATSHHDKTITTRTKREEFPQLAGSFVTRIVPLDSMKKLKMGIR